MSDHDGERVMVEESVKKSSVLESRIKMCSLFELMVKKKTIPMVGNN